MTVAVELLLIVPVVTVNVAVVAVAAPATDAGTVRVALLFVRLTLAPPAGAGWVRVTVHVPDELCPRLLGLHDRLDSCAEATRVTVVLAELLS